MNTQQIPSNQRFPVFAGPIHHSSVTSHFYFRSAQWMPVFKAGAEIPVEKSTSVTEQIHSGRSVCGGELTVDCGFTGFRIGSSCA